MQKPVRTRFTDLMAGDVREYLLAHPDFLDENPDLLGKLVPPYRKLSGDVSDFQHFQIAHLQAEAAELQNQCDRLENVVEENARRDRRLHSATLGLLEAQNIEDLITVVRQDLRILLDHESVEILMEEGGPFLGASQVMPEGFVYEWLPEREISLESDIYGVPDLFGARAGKVRSQALVRLAIGLEMPPGMLVLGHRNPSYYADGTATEPVLHLASVIEFCIRKWLHLP